MIDLAALGQFLYSVALGPFMIAGGSAVVIVMVVSLMGFIYRLKSNL